MFTVTLNQKTYQVDYVRAKALREMGGPLEIMRKMREEKYYPDGDALDTLVKWFCIFCGNQFSAEEMLEDYPADRLLIDIFSAVSHCQGGVTEVLSRFPTQAEARPPQTDKEA